MQYMQELNRLSKDLTACVDSAQNNAQLTWGMINEVREMIESLNEELIENLPTNVEGHTVLWGETQYYASGPFIIKMEVNFIRKVRGELRLSDSHSGPYIPANELYTNKNKVEKKE